MNTLTQDARNVLKLESVKKLSSIPVIGIDVEEEFGTEGEDALRVWIIIPDDTPDEVLAGTAVSGLKFGIRRLLIQNGIDLFPYASFRTVTERKEDLEDSDA